MMPMANERFEKVLSVITQTGSVILTTVASFLIKPPVMTPANDVINWHNVFVFIAGVTGVLMTHKVVRRSRIVRRNWILTMLVLLVITLVTYQILYTRNTVRCFDEVVLVKGSEVSLRPEVRVDLEGWKMHPDPIAELLQAYQCDPTRLWDYTTLAIPYYLLQANYLVVSLLITACLALMARLILNPGTKAKP